MTPLPRSRHVRTAHDLPRRVAASASIVVLVLVLHAAVLGVVWPGVAPAARPGARPPLQVRQLPGQPGPQAAAETAPAPARVSDAAPAAGTIDVAAAPLPAADAAAKLPTAAPGAAPIDAADTRPTAPAHAATTAASADPDPWGPEGAPAAEAGGVAVPVFATRPPPPVRLQFDLRRGGMRGQADFAWRPGPEGYRLSMTGATMSLPLLSWTSSGGFDDAGLAPERFVDRRRAREQRAVNFRRDRGVVTFSGPSVALPLAPGAQDRLSWMIQLPAIVAAAPERFVPGQQVPMLVFGARGGADLWTFDVESAETVDLPEGRVEGALRLQRLPRRPYDVRVEIWLDPARHHLPVRVVLAPSAGEGTEFALRSASFAD